MKNEERSSIQETIAQILEQMKEEQGADFKLSDVNLAELERMTGISRGKLRKIKNDGFVVKSHGNTGKVRSTTVISGFGGVIDGFLSRGIKNSNTIFNALKASGYTGGRSQVKEYIRSHMYLLPARRECARS